MATKAKPRKKAPDILDLQKTKTDWDKLLTQVKESPVMYGAIVVFLLVCILVGLLYRVSVDSGRRTKDTQFAEVVETEDPGVRVTELEPLAAGKGSISADALYMLGESAFRAKEYDKAKEAFERLRREFPTSPFVPTAVEGLGLLAENDGRYEEAVALFREIIEKWPNSLARRRQHLNIGRAEEHLLDLQGAVAAYQAQAEQFPESPFAAEAKTALDRLQKTNPELFPKPAAPQEAAPEPASPAAPETPVAPQTPPAPETPPAQPVPAEGAAAAPAPLSAPAAPAEGETQPNTP